MRDKHENRETKTKLLVSLQNN